ncbi:MAG: crossover junction endodeoxyribonuclease RuvC [Candidatus Peribacteraceae bacterium]|nr:crossover junction endodeoxyribonuclease RuvC [Candidatus Peribacteraceae bacterium]
MRILGIDPGLATIGLGVVEATSVHDIACIEWLTIMTKAGKSAADRLLEIHRDLGAFLKEAKPDLAVVERLFFETNVQTAMGVAEARGVILLTLAEHGIPLIEPTPLQLKSTITGDGRADKQQVQQMLLRMLKLTEVPTPDDAADALALAVYGAVVHHPQTLIADSKHAR